VASAERRTIIGAWTPTGEGAPFQLTPLRQQLLKVFAWAWLSPWKGTGGTNDRLGHLAVLSVAFRANKGRISLSVRQFGELIGTKRVDTAFRVLGRLVEQGKIRRVGADALGAVYDVVLDVPERGSHRNTLESLPSTSLDSLCVPLTPPSLVPDAFLGNKGLPKTAYLLYQYLDSKEPLTQAELVRRTGKDKKTVKGHLERLSNEGLAVKTPKGWIKASDDVQAVAERRGTLGAADAIRQYNQQQRQAYLAWREGRHEADLHEAPIQARAGRMVAEAGAAIRGAGRAAVSQRGAQPVPSTDGRRLPVEPVAELGHHSPGLLADDRPRQPARGMGLGTQQESREAVCVGCGQVFSVPVPPSCPYCKGKLALVDELAIA
jgi:hypothetical protein